MRQVLICKLISHKSIKDVLHQCASVLNVVEFRSVGFIIKLPAIRGVSKSFEQESEVLTFDCTECRIQWRGV